MTGTGEIIPNQIRVNYRYKSELKLFSLAHNDELSCDVCLKAGSQKCFRTFGFSHWRAKDHIIHSSDVAMKQKLC